MSEPSRAHAGFRNAPLNRAAALNWGGAESVFTARISP